jgi:pimeloyl-ACP methyl ester carboxylesterase
MTAALAIPLVDNGSGAGPSVVFVHGLASAGRSWNGLASALPPAVGRVAVDLPGHGRSPRHPPYSFGAAAVAVGRVCAGLPAPVTVVGHSLGGAVALLVGTGLFGADVARVITIGTKVSWTETEADRARSVAAKPAKVFPTRAAALEFWRRVAGVPAGLAVPEELVVDVLVAADDGWRLSYDPAVAGLGAAPVRELTVLNTAEVVAVRGEHDPVLAAEDHASTGAAAALTVPGSGHSPHLEDSRGLAALLGLAHTPIPRTGGSR